MGKKQEQQQQQQVGLLLELVDYSCAFGIGFRFGSLPSPLPVCLLADKNQTFFFSLPHTRFFVSQGFRPFYFFFFSSVCVLRLWGGEYLWRIVDGIISDWVLLGFLGV